MIVLEKPREYAIVDFDGLWKKLIHELIEEFILFFAPDLYEDIDFGKKPEFLQQELFQEIIKEKKGRLVADQVVKVFLRNGEEKWILIHIEVQGNRDSDFPERMFRYYYRIFDLYERDVVAIALLTDDSKHFRSNEYQRCSYGTILTYKFNTFKFMDHDETELLKSNNPFAIAVLAGKYANEAKSDEEKRYLFKRKLFRLILQNIDFPHQVQRLYLSALIYFIDYLLQLPFELSNKFRNEIIQLEEGEKMMHLDRNNLPPTWAEWKVIFKQEGRKEGLEEAQKQFAIELLKDGHPLEWVAKYVKIPIEELEKLQKGL